MISHNIFLCLSDISISIMPCRFIHVVKNSRIFFFILMHLHNSLLPTYITFSSFIIDRHLAFSLTWAIMNNAVVNMGIQTSLRDYDFISFGYITRSGIALSHGSSIFKTSILFFTVTVPVYISTKSIQRFPFFSICCQLFVFVFFFHNRHPTGVRWYLTASLTCISLSFNDIWHICMYLLAICMSLEKCLFKFLVQF